MKKILSLILTMLTFFNINQAKAEENNMSDKKVLVVYFSRTGEQYSVGNISEGNTAVIAKLIAKHTGADMFEIKLKNDTYPAGYNALTEVAQKEKRANARPEIIGNVENFADYDVVFLGSPNWWADMPMAVYTFIEANDWSGKTVVPFVTHEGSGLSSIPTKQKEATGAKVLDGLAIYGHVAQNSRAEAEEKVTDWLKKIGF